ncbi:MAG: DUF5711 family protein [Clostridia bacterium]|nr:DUF5711 family protein [Clostridia bacterium]
MPRYRSEQKKRTPMAALIIVLAAVFIVLMVYLVSQYMGSSKIKTYSLRCQVNQNVTVFGDRVLYYSNGTLFCLTSSGAEVWSVSIGNGAQFDAGSRYISVWSGRQLQILDRNGHATYNNMLGDTIQFARTGEKYVAVVTGDNISPTLTIIDVNGSVIDTESNNYEDVMLLDCGFFGDGSYIWTTSLDVYGTVPQSSLITYRAGQMNTGSANLGQRLPYSVVYCGSTLNVIDTRELRQFDYHGTENPAGAATVYGWQLVSSLTNGSSAYLLFTPVQQVENGSGFTELRLLKGTNDTRYTLPSECVGAALYKNKVYAFSASGIYRADISDNRFTGLDIPVNGNVTAFLGITSNGCALLASGASVYAVVLP